ncbi:hypothetical protein SCAR479_04785 [Seiridium cardinale]|uniref:Uncharacterized protein n=1 Tax=Seiridium cardinale TaxID=138064 RepID=A0ABR2XX48_9PEZI
MTSKSFLIGCYAGQLRESAIFLGNNLERLWNLATDLEMPSFANHRMTSIMTKYAYHFKEDIRDFCGPDAKLPEHDGPLYMFQNNRSIARRGKLLYFMETLLQHRGPLNKLHETPSSNKQWEMQHELNWYRAFREVPIFEHWVLYRPKLNIAEWWLNTRQDWMIKTPINPFAPFGLQIDVCRKLRENEDDAPDKNYTVDIDLKKCIATKEFEKFEESLRLAHMFIETSMRNIRSQPVSRKRARESEENEASSEVVERRSKQQ